MRGVVAAGHPLTAEAGANVLKAGGNAVDAAVAAVLMSFVAESPLTGPGAGGFMVVHTPGESHVLDFFVAAPGLGLDGREPAALVPIDVKFSEDAIQRFNVGPASCGAYGTTLGLAETLRRFGTVDLGDLTAAPARAARDGVEVVPMQAFLFEVLRPILTSTPECAAIYAPDGRLLAEGDTIRLLSWATCSTGSAPRGRASSTPATWRTRSATGCWSAAGCSAATTSPHTR